MENCKPFVYITDYLEVNSGKDVSDIIQKVIDDNPNTTIFFPDGEYLVSKPILTPAQYDKSVCLKLSGFATLRVIAENWPENEAVVRLGATYQCNNIFMPGSNYFFEGGIIDGSGVANGISIDGGRETKVRNISIKNTEIGIVIKWGTNNGSSDMDISYVDIVGNHSATSIGVLVEGLDNTFSYMRIAGINKGVVVKGGGNVFRYVHPLYYFKGENAEEENYLKSISFDDHCDDNIYDVCYSDNFCTAFALNHGANNTYDKSYVFWYTAKGNSETAFKCSGPLNSTITGPKITFNNDATNCTVLSCESGGKGVLQNPVIRRIYKVNEESENEKYSEYLAGKLIAPY